MNRTIGQPGLAQRGEIFCANILWRERELQRIIQQCPRPRFKRSTSRITLDGCEQVIIFGQRTESLSVMLHSIMAFINNRDGNCNRFALGSRQLRAAKHQLAIEVQMRSQNLRMQAMSLENVSHFTTRLGHFIVGIA